MSSKISVVSVALAFVVLFATACSGVQDRELVCLFQKPFSAKVEVTNSEGSYSATLSLGQCPSLDSIADAETEVLVRDGSVVYTAPDSISEISAVRTDGVVCVNVSGVELIPSANIAAKYTYLIDLLDLKPQELQIIKKDELDGEAVLYLTYKHSDREVCVCINENSGMPLSLDNGEVRVSFLEFIYI